MIIRKDAHARRYIMDTMCAQLGTGQREGLHVSDLLAPLRAYWSHVTPRLPTYEEVLYFTAGKGHEGVLLGLMRAEHCEDEKWEGILWFSPDTKLFGKPAEVKTRRVKIKDDPRDDIQGYLEQVMSYCVCSKTDEAFVIVLYLSTRRDDFTTMPDLYAYYIKFTEEELKMQEHQMIETHRILESAILQKNPALLPWCEEWKCGAVIKNKVLPGFCETCGKELNANQLNSHLKQSKGKCLSTRPPKYELSFVPKCRWIDICNPPIVRRFNGEETDGTEQPGVVQVNRSSSDTSRAYLKLVKRGEADDGGLATDRKGDAPSS